MLNKNTKRLVILITLFLSTLLAIVGVSFTVTWLNIFFDKESNRQ